MYYCAKAQDDSSITESFDELCCLSPKYQCDGIVECKMMTIKVTKMIVKIVEIVSDSVMVPSLA